MSYKQQLETQLQQNIKRVQFAQEQARKLRAEGNHSLQCWCRTEIRQAIESIERLEAELVNFIL